MPVVIVTKQKTEHQSPERHKVLVPLRVTEIREDRLRDFDRKNGITNEVEVGDVIIVMPGRHSHELFNCTKQHVVDTRYWDNGGILCLRAYDVAQIVLTNDNEPAPV